MGLYLLAHTRGIGRLKSSIIVLLGLFATAGVALGAAAPAGAAPGTCTRYWTGATSSAWATATNWSNTNGGPGSTVPGATDVACMSTAPARSLVIVSDSRAIAGLSFPDTASVHPTLRIDTGGGLSVGGAAPNSYDSDVRLLDLRSGSTLGGSALIVAGSAGTIGGVDLSGTGTLRVAPGGTLTIPATDSPACSAATTW